MATKDEHGHCWHSDRRSMEPTEICCHCGAKREAIVAFRAAEGCGPFAPKTAMIDGYRGVADRMESVAGTHILLSIGTDRWRLRCTAPLTHRDVGDESDAREKGGG